MFPVDEFFCRVPHCYSRSRGQHSHGIEDLLIGGRQRARSMPRESRISSNSIVRQDKDVNVERPSFGIKETKHLRVLIWKG